MRTPRAQDGAVLLLVAVSLTVLLGMAALVADLGQFRAHRRQLQTAADAGALAGALQLPPFSDGSNSCARANTIERQNSNLTDGKNMVVNGNLSTSYCEIIGSSVRVKPVESSVPYIFGRVLGFASTTIDARARARVVYLTRSTGLLPFGVEDLRPKSVTAIVDKTGQRIPLALCGSQTPEGFPYWCNAGGNAITGLPAGGSTVSLEVVDNTNKVIDWSNLGYVGSDQAPTAGATATACTAGQPCVKDVVLSPLTDPYLYYTSTSAPKTFDVLAHTSNVASNANVSFTFNGKTNSAVLQSCTGTDCTWHLPSNKLFTSATTEAGTGQNVTVTIGSGKSALKTVAPAQHQYARDDGDIVQQWVQDRHYIDPSLPANSPQRFVTFNVAFTVLVKGREITLKLGGGGAQGNSGNYGGLDLDTTNGSGACHGDTSGTPNAAEEVQYGACTPYSIGDPVNTQTGNFAGQVNNGLTARIGNSPDNWTTTANPPPPGDPRWMSLILVPPITFSNCNGNCTTQVVGFGSFYITEYSGQQGSTLKQGEVKGIFWDRPVLINQYTTTCNDPENICLASVALMPWDG
ncbi:MAG TPA: pilus assembly protein TadG-related protein [Gaiellales bacterium]|jgi:hypothetical protein|nr:pilus assembly protein TadG-related protein [Gaiellales bacterium]